MYLKSLHIKNFRCFADYTIEFAPGVTVLFGKNGSGKTTLIHAIHKALSFAFKEDTSEDALNLGAGFLDLKPRNYNREEDLVRDHKTGLPYPFIDIHANATFEGVGLDWSMYASTSSFEVQEKMYADAVSLLKGKVRETNRLPMFAYFSDGFPHVTKETKLTETEMSLRNLGYLGWDEEVAYSDLWTKRLTLVWTMWDRANRAIDREEAALRNCETFKATKMVTEDEYKEDVELHTSRLENAKREKEHYDGEIQAIRNCLAKFTKGDKNLEVNDFFVSVYEESGLCLQTRDGKNPPFLNLPAGYKRLIFMVLDIAYRSFLLSNKTTTDMPGIVVIDEVDLHLHPELEQVVLQRLMKTFPSVQFIVSTHSPSVLTGIETSNRSNVVLHMQPDSNGPELLQNVYGIDCNQMLEENMDVAKRISEIDELFKKAWNEVAAKNIEEAKKTVQTLEATSTPSDQTELVKLRAVISRLEIIGR